ncbi:cationic amino acid transporter 3-like [Cotesia typhae]|uniref:cationic amino acid transporter 3-like n=1 Tax=Cotesia typhae TaxID=2053667 RepID=UPI003D6848E2
MLFNELCKALTRKRVDENNDKNGQLARVLGLFNLVTLGVGSTLGVGVYVLTGYLAKEVAGPAVCLSFLIAAFASSLAGLCYAEFAARVPKAGSAYIYSYVTVGEIIAFIIGWTLVLEYVIIAASVARSLSIYIDSFTDDAMKKFIQSTMPIKISFLSDYPDFFAFSLIMFISIIQCTGVKKSSYFNTIATNINLLTICVVVISGCTKVDINNWYLEPKDIPVNATKPEAGGFMPFGMSGVMAATAKCFFAFVGFDAIATTGEEAKNPQRNIPFAIITSLLICCLAYFSVSVVLTMMWPYYDQNPETPFPYVFKQLEWPVILWIVNIGAIFAFCTCLFGGLFSLPRILYAMGSDGIIFKFLSNVNKKTKTPATSILCSGLFSGFISLIFNLSQLMDMLSVGTLLAYTMVSICVIILRYQKTVITEESNINISQDDCNLYKKIFNINNKKVATEDTSKIATWGVVLFSILVFIFGVTSYHVQLHNDAKNLLGFIFLTTIVVMIVLTLTAIRRQPVNPARLSFKVPLVPFIPCCSIFVNIFLMIQLDIFTWLRLIIWLILGFCIYFFYGIRHSVQRSKDNKKNYYNNTSATLNTTF